MTRSRPDWDHYFMGISSAVAKRADCTRRQVGAIVVDSDHRILGTGYNGSTSKGPSCLEGQCPRGQHYLTSSDWAGAHCACGFDWPCSKAVAPGSSYDTGAGVCIALHAEQNCLLWARSSVKGCTLYVTEEPCDGCSRMIAASGVARVVTPSTLL